MIMACSDMAATTTDGHVCESTKQQPQQIWHPTIDRYKHCSALTSFCLCECLRESYNRMQVQVSS